MAGFGALVINPKRKPARRKNAVRINRKPSRKPAARKNAAKRVSRTKAGRFARGPARKNVARKNAVRVNRKRSNAARKAWAARRRNTRTNPVRVNRRQNRRNPVRVNARRAAPRIAYKNKGKRVNSRKNYVARRRNPDVMALFQPIMGMLNKIPVIGPLLAQVVGFAPQALFGALGVEPSLLAAKYLGGYVPQLNSSLFYVLVSAVLAALVGRFAPVSPALRKQLAVALAAGGGAVGYYKWRTGDSATVAEEAAGMWGDVNMAIQPGVVELTEYEIAEDAWEAPEDFDADELGAAQRGAWQRPPKRNEQRKGKKYHRWLWLVKLIGKERFQALAQQPPEVRRHYIGALKQYAVQSAQRVLSIAGPPPQQHQAQAIAPPPGEAAGYGYGYGAGMYY